MNKENKVSECSILEKLSGNEGKYIMIPSSVIMDTNIDPRRVAAFSFFAVRKGLDNKLWFSINNAVEWCGFTPDKHTGGMNKKFVKILNQFKDRGYLTFSDELKMTSYVMGEYNSKKVLNENSSFAVLYLDEIEKILRYKRADKRYKYGDYEIEIKARDTYLNSSVLLLVFAYLRMKIVKRSNHFNEEDIDRYNGNIESRKKDRPEAYNCYFKDIAQELGISIRSVSKAVYLLMDMGLIYFKQLSRIRYKRKNESNDKWLTLHTIFSNTYKREKDVLLDCGERYYKPEIENKIKRIRYILRMDELGREGDDAM